MVTKKEDFRLVTSGEPGHALSEEMCRTYAKLMGKNQLPNDFASEKPWGTPRGCIYKPKEDQYGYNTGFRNNRKECSDDVNCVRI